jgi:UDP-glucose 4-epimerase
LKIAITGATGFVGGTTLRALIGAGHDVRALTRRPQAVQAGVTWVQGGLCDHAALSELCAGADAVLHIAGVVNAADKAAFDAANVTGTANVLAAAKGAGVARFVHVSSLSAREPALSMYGHSKQRGEALVRASAMDWTVIRPPGVYGPGDTEMLDSFRLAKFRIAPMPPKGRVSLIHVDDLACLLVAVAQDSGVSLAQVYEPDDGTNLGWSHIEFAHMIGRAMGHKVFAFNLPAVLLSAAARIDEAMRGEKAKLTRDRAAYLSHPDWVVTAAARPPESLWRPRITAPNGIRDTVQWYKAEGWL